MNHKQTLVILGSGLMVLALATAAGFFLFAPASSTAQISRINGTSDTTYDDFVPTPDANAQAGNLEAQAKDNTALSLATLPSSGPGGYAGRSISSSSLATQRQRMAFRTSPAPSTGAQRQNQPYTSGRPTSAQDLQSIMDAQRLSQSTLSAPGPVPVPPEEFVLKQSNQSSSSPQYVAESPKTTQTRQPAAPKPQPKASHQSKQTQNYSSEKTPAKVAAKPAEKRRATGYWIQLASYSTLNRAKGAQDDLRRLGLNTSIEVSNLGAGKLVYRVKAGAWANEKEAKNFLETFTRNNKGFSDAFVVNSAL